MQRPGEFDSSPGVSIRRWHPKLTPYRLLVLGTTTGVGTAKAIAAQEGDESASTTLEWVSGVVIFLILHSMSTYDDSPMDPPPLLDWMFTVDFMDYLWRIFSLLRIPRPSYSSEPEPRLRCDMNACDTEHKSNATPITPYRLFVCITTAVFGLTKAMMTYFGYSVGANWVDWMLGAVVTSILFILGMYEDNTVGMWHAFFVPDYTAETLHGLGAASISLVILGWLGLCAWMIPLMWTSPYSVFFSSVEDVHVSMSSFTPLAVLREKLLDACFSLLMLMTMAVSAFLGLMAVGAVLSLSGLPRWVDVGESIMRQASTREDGYTALEPEGLRPSKKIAYHIISLVTLLIGCMVFLAFWVVCIAANIEEGYMLLHTNSDSKLEPRREYLVFMGITIFFQMTGAVATAYFMWLVAWGLLFPPLLKRRSGDAGWEKALLF